MDLPEVSSKDLLVWDNNRSECCGYLSKKASQSSAFSKGKWQKRWFMINIDIADDENYCLEYYHNPDDKAPRQVFPLAYSSIALSGGNSFILTLADDSTVSLSAENNELMTDWVETIENVIAVANLREKVLEQFDDVESSANDRSTNKGESTTATSRSENSPYKGSGPSSPMRSPTKKSIPQQYSNPDDGSAVSAGDGGDSRSESQPRRLPPSAAAPSRRLLRPLTKFVPSVRLDIDIQSIPPSSTLRHQFKESFVADIAKYLDILPEMVEVVSIKPAPGIDWLTVVEFDILVDGNEPQDTSTDRDYQDSIALERSEQRDRYLWTLQSMVHDSSSVLYNGLVTSKLDPSYMHRIVERDARREEFVPFSTDPKVLEIMNRYKDTVVPDDEPDLSHFTIHLHFEDRVYPMSVPNPMVLQKRCCAIWPFEIKQLLGFIGTMQELWIEPSALVPRDQPKSLTHPILFQPSARMGGAVIINASRLQADMEYDVQCEDQREEALNSLSQEEMDSIKDTFQRYDINGDGGISRAEMDELVRQRTAERKAIIEEKFQTYIEEAEEGGIGLSHEEIAMAEHTKAQYLQQVTESQTKLIKMFEAADTNGDGVISFTEFIMAEAWWLRCTINPEKAHLF